MVLRCAYAWFVGAICTVVTWRHTIRVPRFLRDRSRCSLGCGRHTHTYAQGPHPLLRARLGCGLRLACPARPTGWVLHVGGEVKGSRDQGSRDRPRKTKTKVVVAVGRRVVVAVGRSTVARRVVPAAAPVDAVGAACPVTLPAAMMSRLQCCRKMHNPPLRPRPPPTLPALPSTEHNRLRVTLPRLPPKGHPKR